MKISVAMTTYNGARFLRDQLDSIIAQSRLPDELIVCDDCSSDETPEILRDYAGRAPFPMRVFVNETRLNSTKNFEKAIRLCSGDVIALCDQDDVWKPEKLCVLESAFSADSKTGLVFSNADLMGSDGAPLRGDLWSKFKTERYLRDGLTGPSRHDLLLGFPLTTGATMAFRSSFKPLLLPFPTEAPTFIHDRWIAVVIAAVASVAVIRDKLISYRVHDQQQLGVGKMPLALRIFVPHRCRSDAAGLATLHERLQVNSDYSPSAEFWRALADRQCHIDARLKYARDPIRRLRQVVAELWSGRYVRYPHGLAVSLQDMLVGTR